VLEAKLEIKPWTVDATLWRAPEGVVASELPHCADEKAHVTGAKAIHLERPEYPTLASNTRQRGRVVLYATLGRDGRIKNLVLLQSAGEMLDRAAYNSVKNWTYEPRLKCGVPIEMEFPITVNFTLAR
jgi:TonB family protein